MHAALALPCLLLQQLLLTQLHHYPACLLLLLLLNRHWHYPQRLQQLLLLLCLQSPDLQLPL
jgi:hypothetical protein